MELVWPLVGRAEELAAVTAAVDVPGCRGVVLSGEAGVGKTRLAVEIADRLAARGWHVARVAATRSMAGISFGAMVHMLPEGMEVAGSEAELLKLLRDELLRQGAERRVLLVVDDAHLLDPASAAATHMLAATGTVFVLVSARAKETAPDAVAALWKEGLARRIELRPLNRAESDQALAAGLGGHVDAMTRDRLWRATHGNALYLYELVRAGVERGSLSRVRGVWTWSGDVDFGERLSELIEARLAGLTPEERGVLEILALGEPLGPAFLPDSPALSQLEERGLLTVTQDGLRTLLRLSHPLYAEALRTGMGMLRRRSVLTFLADRMAAFGARRRGDLRKVATWRLDGGCSLDAPSLLVAARESRAVFDHRGAERFARAAVAAGGGADAHVRLADALYWQERHAEAADVLAAVPDEPGRDDASLAWQAIVTASNLFWGHDDPDAADDVLRAAQRAIGAGAEHDELAAHRAGMAGFGGDPRTAVAVAEPVLVAPTATMLTRARALGALLPALATSGAGHRAIDLADLGIRVASEVAEHEPWSLSHFRMGQVTGYWLTGDAARMLAAADAGHALAIGRHADDTRGMWAALLGRALLETGRVTAARTQYREAAGLLRARDVAGFLSWALAGGATACALLGAVSEAKALLAEARARRRAAVRIHDSELETAAAWVAVALGDLAEAKRRARAAADVAGSLGLHALEAIALHDAVRIGVHGVAGRLARLARKVDGEGVAAFAAHAGALADDDATALATAADRLAGLGMDLAAAEAAAGSAAAHGRRGDLAAQLAALSRARDLAAVCPDASTPALAALADPSPTCLLTAREREIAALAAAGLTNREISERLVLSVRTVGNHLNHVYGKLAITRADLPRLFAAN